MRQELIDLVRGELSPAAETRLRARLSSDPALALELEELLTLSQFMDRGEEIEPAPDSRSVVMAAAEHATRPTLLQQIRALPGLFRYRFRRSLAFRVAAVSLGVHLIAMAILFQFSVADSLDEEQTAGIEISPAWDDQQDLRPATSFVNSLSQRRLPHTLALGRWGLAGQEDAIQAGLNAILASQRPDGTFGSVPETAYGAMALLAQGDCSAMDTRRGRAIRAAMPTLLHEAVHGQAHGAVLSALVEDWALSFAELDDQQRYEYANAILRLIRRLDDDEAAREGLFIATLANIPVPKRIGLGDLSGDADALLAQPVSRLRASVVLARGQRLTSGAGRLKTWLRPLFQRAMQELLGAKPSALAVLTLQAPYRL